MDDEEERWKDGAYSGACLWLALGFFLLAIAGLALWLIGTFAT